MRTRQIQIRMTVALFALAGCLFFLTSPAEAFPPSNGRIAFASTRTGNLEVFSMNPNGTDQINLSSNSAFDSDPSWSPDGKKIAFDSTRDGNFEIYVMNADGSNPTRLTFVGPPGSIPPGNFLPSWSPDGTRIAFDSSRDGNHEIYVMNADGTNQVRLTIGPAGDSRPSWSPDGTKIVFDSGRDGNLEIYVMNADGTNQTRLTNNSTIDVDPAFSPDGTKIVFQREVGSNGPNGQIFVMNADGTSPVQLTSISRNTHPAYSPDGTKIAFSSFRDGNDEIYIMNVDGTSQARLTNTPEFESAPNWQPILPPETIGLYRPSTSQFLERNTNTSGRANAIVAFGQAGDLPIAGDWNGDGISDVGVFRNGQFLLRQPKVVTILGGQTITIITTITVNFGAAGDLPVVGDWNGDGIDTPAVFRNGQFLLTNSNPNNGSPPAAFVFGFGQLGDRPVAGDWNDDGIDTIGVFRPSTGTFFLTNVNPNNTQAPGDVIFNLGLDGDFPVSGDWNADGVDTLGVFRPSTGTFFLSNTFISFAVDLIFNFGQSGDLPVAGVWGNQPPNSGVNSPSSGSSQAGQTQVFTTTCSDPDGWRDIHTIDFIVGRHKVNGDDDRGGEEKGDKDKGDKNNDDDDGDRTIALWVQFDENRNVIRLYDPDLEVWREGSPGANVTLSSRFADLHLAGTHVQGSGPTGPSVQVTWEVVFKDSAIKKNYKQFLKITDDAGSSTDFDRVGSWKVTR